MLLKQAAGIAKDLIRMNDYASEALDLGLASPSVVSVLGNLDTPNAGKKW